MKHDNSAVGGMRGTTFPCLAAESSILLLFPSPSAYQTSQRFLSSKKKEHSVYIVHIYAETINPDVGDQLGVNNPA